MASLHNVQLDGVQLKSAVVALTHYLTSLERSARKSGQPVAVAQAYKDEARSVSDLITKLSSKEIPL